jgi:hypothetical protein
MAESQPAAALEEKKLKIASISEFFNSEVLSDIIVVNPQTGASYK